MKLGTVIRAIVRPALELSSGDDRILLRALGPSGFGIGMVANWQSDLSWPARARCRRIGDLTVAWWGRDTLVHPAPEAS